MRIGNQIYRKPNEGEEAVCGWTENRYQFEAQKFLAIDRNIRASLFARARQKKSGAKPMAWKAQELIKELFVSAREGNQEAASLLAGLLHDSVIQLTELAKSNPKLLQPVARRSSKWPVMKSLHPLLSDEHETMLGEINLGYDLPFYFVRQSKWRFDDFSKIALDLLAYVWGARRENRRELGYGKIGELADTLPTFRKGENAKT